MAVSQSHTALKKYKRQSSFLNKNDNNFEIDKFLNFHRICYQILRFLQCNKKIPLLVSINSWSSKEKILRSVGYIFCLNPWNPSSNKLATDIDSRDTFYWTSLGNKTSSQTTVVKIKRFISYNCVLLTSPKTPNPISNLNIYR